MKRRIEFIRTGVATVMGLVALPAFMVQPERSRIPVEQGQGREYTDTITIDGSPHKLHFHYSAPAVAPFKVNKHLWSHGMVSPFVLIEPTTDVPFYIWDVTVLPV